MQRQVVGDDLGRTDAGGQRPLHGQRPLPGRFFAILALFVLAVMGLYLISSSRASPLGFPLDDAWIHQTYARNLGLRGEWAFIPGHPSAGSTSPLWSALLALGYLLRINPFVWTFLLGGLSLLGLALAGEAWFRASLSRPWPAFPLAGLFLAGEWHLVWASVSGMETLLFGLFILLVLWQISRASNAKNESNALWGAIGLLIGISVWVRPDGLTLLGPAVMVLLLVKPSWKARLHSLVWLGAGAAIFFTPYLFFNWKVSGSILPNTFYAKQAEYAAQRSLPLVQRFFNEATLPLIGAGLFLLPGFVAFVWKSFRERQWAAMGAILWFLGYALLYALRLPVTYQYGRYFMPAMPVFFVTGLLGTWDLVSHLRGNRMAWLLARVAMLSGGIVWAAFTLQGAARYTTDVTFIQTNMVAPAQWVAAHTEPDALVAAHDIGAIGYFGQRQILDLAGLVSPEVIPFIRDENQLSGWLDRQQVDYLVVLNGWYTHLADGKPVVFQAGDGAETLPMDNQMVIYKWKP